MNILNQFAQSAYTYSDGYTSSTTSDTELLAIAGGLLVVWILLFLGTYVFSSIFLMLIFKKAGVQGWAAWVPILNNWKTLEIGGQKGFWAILALIPVVNIISVVYLYIALYNIGLKLGKGGAFLVLAILLYPVWLVWLAVDHSVWNDAAGAPSLADAAPATTPAAATAAAPADAATANPYAAPAQTPGVATPGMATTETPVAPAAPPTPEAPEISATPITPDTPANLETFTAPSPAAPEVPTTYGEPEQPIQPVQPLEPEQPADPTQQNNQPPLA